MGFHLHDDDADADDNNLVGIHDDTDRPGRSNGAEAVQMYSTRLGDDDEDSEDTWFEFGDNIDGHCGCCNSIRDHHLLHSWKECLRPPCL